MNKYQVFIDVPQDEEWENEVLAEIEAGVLEVSDIFMDFNIN